MNRPALRVSVFLYQAIAKSIAGQGNEDLRRKPREYLEDPSADLWDIRQTASMKFCWLAPAGDFIAPPKILSCELIIT